MVEFPRCRCIEIDTGPEQRRSITGRLRCISQEGGQAARFDPHTERHRPIKSLFCLPRGGPLHNLASNCQPHNWEVEYAKAIHVPDYLHPVSPSSIQRSSLILGRKFNFRLQKMLPLKCLFLEPKPPTVPIETNVGVMF